MVENERFSSTCFEDMALFIKLSVDQDKCSQGFFQESNCSPSHGHTRDVCV